jgi:membrane protein YdbS with pleckstrin-like domain
VPYPDKLLANDEQVVEHLHPHWITLVPATLWFLAICAAAGLAIGYAPSSGTTHSAFIIAIVVVAVVALMFLTVKPWLAWRTTHYVFTTHRVLIRKGIMRHTGRDIALQRINDVGFSQSLWDRIVKAGTLTIESAGEQGQEDLQNVPRSNQMQQTLNRLIEEDGNRRARMAYGGGAYPPGSPQGPPPGHYPPQGQPPGQYAPPGPYPQQDPPQGQYPPQGQPGNPYPTQQYPPR